MWIMHGLATKRGAIWGRTFAASRRWSSITLSKIQSMIDVFSIEPSRTSIPRARTDEDATLKPLWSVIAVGSARVFQCSRCNSQTLVTAGTLFQETRKPLATWFRATWYVTSQKNGASALACSEFSDWELSDRLVLAA